MTRYGPVRALRRRRRRLPHHRARRPVDVAGRPEVGRPRSPTCGSTSAARRTSGTSATGSSTASAPSPRPAGPSTRRRTRSCWPRRSRPAVDAKARLAYLDEVGVYYQVMYPNILGFHSHMFLESMPRELATECVQAYNDWLVEWCSADSRRLIPMMMLPFWDIDESVAEMKRAYDLGHKGVLFAARYDKVGLPRLVDDDWEPVLGQAQEMGLSHELPRRLPRLPRRPQGRGRPVEEDGLHPGELTRAPRQRPEHRRGRAERRVRPLPEPELRVGGERRRMAAVPRREHGLAVAQRRRPQGLPRPPAARAST